MSAQKSIAGILHNIDRLPTMPKAVTEIIRRIEDDNITIDSLAQLVGSDIGLASSMLKVANTTRFSIRGTIASVNDAVLLVGVKQIRDIVCVVGVMGSFPKHKAPWFDFTNFWRHSLGVAVCARILAKQAKLNPDVAFISGMLHDIGQLALVVAAPDAFQAIADYYASHDNCHIFEAEQEVLGMDHAKIGAHLAKKWELPLVICEAIDKHHKPEDTVNLEIPEATSRMADLIHISEVLSHALELGDNGHTVPPLSDNAMARLGLNFFQVRPHFAQIECEYSNAIVMLG